MSRDFSKFPAWSNVPAALLRDPDLPAIAKLVAAALGVHTRADFTCQVSRSLLAEDLAVSVPSVKRGLRALERGGWIEVVRKRKGAVSEVNRYRWNFRQAGLSIERARKGRAVRTVPAESEGVGSEPTPGRVRKAPKGRVGADPQANSFSTNRGDAVAAGASRAPGDAAPERIGNRIPDSWRAMKAGLRPGRLP